MGEKVKIVGGDNIGRCEQRSFMRTSDYSEMLLKKSCLNLLFAQELLSALTLAGVFGAFIVN
jgi:hypothetical protein